MGEGIKFERIRRITGYLVGDISRMNHAKQEEVRERTKHTTKENKIQNNEEMERLQRQDTQTTSK